MKALRGFVARLGNQMRADGAVIVGNLGQVFVQVVMWWPVALVAALLIAFGPRLGWFSVDQLIEFVESLAYLAGYGVLGTLVFGVVLAVGSLVTEIRKSPGGWFSGLLYALTFLFRGLG